MKTIKKVANILAPNAKKTAIEAAMNPGCTFFLHEPKMPAKLVREMQNHKAK